MIVSWMGWGKFFLKKKENFSIEIKKSCEKFITNAVFVILRVEGEIGNRLLNEYRSRKMFNIKTHLPTFVKEVRSGSALRVTSEGDFYVENAAQNLIRSTFGLEEYRWVEVIHALHGIVRDLEKVPIRFSEDRERAVQVLNFQMYLKAIDAVLQRISGMQTKKMRKARVKLQREKIALLYRLEVSNGGLNPTHVNGESHASFLHAAQVWKSSQTIYDDTNLTKKDVQILSEATAYPELVELILEDDELATLYFLWALRDRIALRPFVEFPGKVETLNRYDLNGRISRRGGADLKVQLVESEEVYEKVLTLPFEGVDISILDEQRAILFRGNYGMTLSEVYEIFDRKKFEAGNLEYMADGIINWNAHHWGWWDSKLQGYHRVDLNQPQWWTQLPVFDHYTVKQAREKFGKHLTGTEYNLAVHTTRLSRDLDYENTHSYTSLSVPQGDGTYIVYTLGKYTFTFPKDMIETMLTIGETAEATVAYPDENVYYTHRQTTRFSYAISEKEALSYFDSVKHDVLLSREGNLIYQIQSENCAKWAYEKFVSTLGQERVPEIFRLFFLESEPHGPMANLFALLRSLPEKLQVPVTTIIHYLLGAHKGRLIIEKGEVVWKSLTYHSFWSDIVIFHPAMLYKKQEMGHIGKSVSFGVTVMGIAASRLVRQVVHALFRFSSSLISAVYDHFNRVKISLGDLSLSVFEFNSYVQVANDQ